MVCLHNQYKLQVSEVSDASGADFPFFFWRLAKVSAEFSDASFSVKKNNK